MADETTTTTTPGYVPPTSGTGTGATGIPLQWSYEAFDPNANSFQDPLSDTALVQTYSPYYPSVSGAFPSWFPQQLKRSDVVKMLHTMSAPEVVRLKQRLFAANYLQGTAGELTGYYAAPPTDPTVDAATETAFLNLFDDAATQNVAGGGAQTLDTWLNSRIQKESGMFRQATTEKYDLGSQTRVLQTWAEENLGRNLRDEEVQSLFAITSAGSSDFSQPYQSGFGTGEGDVAANSVTLRGGGQGSTALSFLNQLAKVYGLQPVTSVGVGDGTAAEAFRDGRALEIAGDPDRLQMLAQWAITQSGKDSVFDQVTVTGQDPNNPDLFKIVISVNDGVTPPPVNGIDYAYQSFGDDVSKFLASVRTVDGKSAYAWEDSQTNQFGAYGLSKQIWDYYTTQVFKNMDSNDHSAQAQDAVARAYANDLFSGHHNWQNWEDVAYAFTTNEDVARERRNARMNNGGMSQTSPANDDNVRLRTMKIINGMAKQSLPSRSTAPFEEDFYSQMFGRGTGQGAPYVSDPFAELPSTPAQYKDRLLNNVQRSYAGEKAHAGILNTIVNLVQKHGLSSLDGKG